jgi:hypothetical protein
MKTGFEGLSLSLVASRFLGERDWEKGTRETLFIEEGEERTVRGCSKLLCLPYSPLLHPIPCQCHLCFFMYTSVLHAFLFLFLQKEN